MNSQKEAANALGGRTARACDSCLRKRARWFCAADDAFLCQGCDASVHSANPLARRHERLRLKTASALQLETGGSNVIEHLPAWHQRKARTPRHSKATTAQDPKTEPMPNPLLVPEIGSDEPSLDENEEQLLYRVPIFDPAVAEFCSACPAASTALTSAAVQESKPTATTGDSLPGFLSSEADIADFAADVESLLGRGLDEDAFCMEGLGLLEAKTDCGYQKKGRVKVEEEEEEEEEGNGVVLPVDTGMDLSRDTLDLNFDYASTGEEEEEEVKVGVEVVNACTEEEDKKGVSLSLTLNYDAVISAWACQGSPWTTGDRPHFNPDDCWPDCMGTCVPDVQQYGASAIGPVGHMALDDGGREARVSRYRQKRRTRLFSKKIRYEVRKLNAEKRPRMKGRFVKRASFAGPAFPFH